MGTTSILAAVADCAAGLSLQAVAPAGAQYCEGRVHGLSRHYNLATGSGFLAVRARPASSSRMVGQLFNGDTVEIFDRRGNWYRVAMGGIDGWASARWMWNSCGY
jgi:uncharacterized protein YgiM (DUF1202 family)